MTMFVTINVVIIILVYGTFFFVFIAKVNKNYLGVQLE